MVGPGGSVPHLVVGESGMVSNCVTVFEKRENVVTTLYIYYTVFN